VSLKKLWEHLLAFYDRLQKPELKIRKRRIGGIPVLECYNRHLRNGPLLFLLHGFSGEKENFRKQLLELASQGYYGVAMDNRGHGERQQEDAFRKLVSEENGLNMLKVRQLIKDSADDLVSLINYYSECENPSINPLRIGVAGISMGGFITYRAMMLDSRIKVGTPLIASPFWEDLPGNLPKELKVNREPEVINALNEYSQKYSPGYHPECFAPRPLLIQIGADDRHFDVGRVTTFYQKIMPNYHENAERVKLDILPNVAHEVTPEMWSNAVNWLKRYL
jgi:pimeloyl-ACP methyl ester carboxylesterase